MPWFCVECGKVNPDGVGACSVCRAVRPVESVRISSARFRIPDAGAPARPSLAHGTLVGRYQLGQHIASGGFATIHLARETGTGQEFALKVLASNLVHNQKLVARFHQEARIQSSLVHPGIVRVFEVVEDAGNVALVMEYVRGVPLDGLLDRLGRPLTPSECCEILVPMLDALEYAHHAGVVHRDLKPSNVLLQANPNLPLGYWPKIADFGVAKVLDEAGVRTATGAALGTSWYMAPEQCRGDRSVDHRADVYAVGIMLYEMVTRTVPFIGESDFAIWEGHIRQAPPRPTVLNPAIAPAMENVILQALEKDPAERFQSAVALRDALQASRVSAASWPGAGQAPAVGVPVSRADATAGAVAARRRPVLFGVAAGLAVALLTIVAVVLGSGGGGGSGRPSSVDTHVVMDGGSALPLDDAALAPDAATDAVDDARAPMPTPTAPYWISSSNTCSDAWCPSDWPVCYLDGALCNNTNCGECAEGLLNQVSPGPADLARAWCIGKMIVDRAPRVAPTNTADRMRRQGWGFQLTGRAMDLRNCRSRAIDDYVASTRQRCQAMRLDPSLETSQWFPRNMAYVEQWCRELGEREACTCTP